MGEEEGGGVRVLVAAGAGQQIQANGGIDDGVVSGRKRTMLEAASSKGR